MLFEGPLHSLTYPEQNCNDPHRASSPDRRRPGVQRGLPPMKFFVDTADISEIRALAEAGLVDGVTTNPSLIAKSGRRMADVIADICSITPGPVPARGPAHDTAGTA